MKSFLRILIVFFAVCSLIAGLRGPKVYASSRIVVAKDAEMDALEALYQDTDGDNWTNNRNWLSNAQLDSWHGVTTDRNGRVVELDLSENELNGTIPSELGSLTNLERLKLSKNQLRGPIPPELGNLSNLKFLDLYENRLSGRFPQSWATSPTWKRWPSSRTICVGQFPQIWRISTIWDGCSSGETS